MSDFQVRLTADFMRDGALVYKDVGLDLLDDARGVTYDWFDRHETEIRPDQVGDADALIVLSPRVTAASLAGADRLALIARFGVGYDSVDVDACTDSDILLTITAGGVNHSVAEATVALMLAISHRVVVKDRLTRQGRWDDRSVHMGTELREKTLGIVGLGGIGQALAAMVGSFRMAEVIAFDPFVTEDTARQAGVSLVDLDTLLERSDFVSINCPLNEHTRNLIDARELALMKPTAYLVNTARGGIVNEAALVDALRGRGIAGAALDCHETEPFPAGHALSEMDNVILAPHAIAWTDELFRDLGRMCCRQALDVAAGCVPPGAVNTEVLDRPGFRAKLERYASGSGS